MTIWMSFERKGRHDLLYIRDQSSVAFVFIVKISYTLLTRNDSDVLKDNDLVPLAGISFSCLFAFSL